MQCPRQRIGRSGPAAGLMPVGGAAERLRCVANQCPKSCQDRGDGVVVRHPGCAFRAAPVRRRQAPRCQCSIEAHRGETNTVDQETAEQRADGEPGQHPRVVGARKASAILRRADVVDHLMPPILIRVQAMPHRIRIARKGRTPVTLPYPNVEATPRPIPSRKRRRRPNRSKSAPARGLLGMRIRRLAPA